MEYEIIGDNLQIAVVKLSSGEMVYAEAGSMVYMSANMQMETKAKGGIMKGVKRMLARESFFMTEFSPSGDGFVAFAGNVPGRIREIELKGNDFMAQKDAFLSAESGVDMDIAFTKKFTTGLFGGEGFILERLSGNGTAFIHACGDFVDMDLGPGEMIKVDTGSVVGFESTVQYSITSAGNVKSMLFGGEGIFLTTLTGPGHIILQSMTIANLAGALRPYMPTGSSDTSGHSGPGIEIGGFKIGV
ncbi:MAG: TIGR00266 family protein [Halobacteriota archaeon]|nr:TIGR00266 family protein [Halobacteriota archaeon]